MTLIKQFEIWKSIVDYPEYIVSDLGNVMRTRNRNKGKAGCLMSFRLDHFGYLRVNLAKNHVMHTVYIHALVSKAFLGERKPGYHVNHIDGNKKNNCLNNLEYVTPQENVQHSYDLGLKVGRRGPRNQWSKLSIANVREIRKLLESGSFKHRQIAERYGVGRTCIKEIAANRNWAWLS